MPSVIWFEMLMCCGFVGRKRTTLTFDNINHTQAKQWRYMIGSRRVNCDGAAHAVANHHDGRRRVSIEHLHYFANIPLEGQNAKLNSLSCNISAKLQTLVCAICKVLAVHTATHLAIVSAERSSWFFTLESPAKEERSTLYGFVLRMIKLWLKIMAWRIYMQTFDNRDKLHVFMTIKWLYLIQH